MALAIGLMASAQVKIGANPTIINAASLLELENSTTSKQGFLLPRVSLVNTTTPTLDGGLNVEGMTVYNIATAGDVTPGLYTNDGTKWVKVGATAALNITAEQTGNYTALATDDIILFNNVINTTNKGMSNLTGSIIVWVNTNVSSGTHYVFSSNWKNFPKDPAPSLEIMLIQCLQNFCSYLYRSITKYSIYATNRADCSFKTIFLNHHL